MIITTNSAELYHDHNYKQCRIIYIMIITTYSAEFDLDYNYKQCRIISWSSKLQTEQDDLIKQDIMIIATKRAEDLIIAKTNAEQDIMIVSQTERDIMIIAIDRAGYHGQSYKQSRISKP